jgi:hypothetical protein
MLAQHRPHESPHPRFEDLDTTGFVVVPGFLTDAEAAMFEADHDDAPPPPSDSYAVRQVSAPARAAVHHKLIDTASAVARASRVHVDHIASGVLGSIYFSTDGEIGTGWHQDSVSYFAYQNHHDYLNFYVPVVKPVRAKSNLCLVPLDRLEARSPEMAAKLRGRAATRLVVKDGTTIVHDKNAGGILGTLPYDLDELAVTPELDRGDLLLVRGDVVHRTQDRDTQRIAVSVRMMNSQGRVRKADVVGGGLGKALVMARGRRDFQQLLDCFAAARRNEMTIGELAERMEHGEPSTSPSQTGFLASLMWHRVRARLAR